uniref:CCHC-type domain-containing protein n=1 Tax=Cynoglossus semilaevis TaxID=244447 RepID=A0A3P8VRA9_CYNSE
MVGKMTKSYQIPTTEKGGWAVPDISEKNDTKCAWGEMQRLSGKDKLALTVVILSQNTLRRRIDAEHKFQREKEILKKELTKMAAVKADHKNKLDDVRVDQTEGDLYPFKEMHEAAQGHNCMPSVDECVSVDDCQDYNIMTRATLRPVVTRRVDRDVIFSYKAAKASDIDQWSKELQHQNCAIYQLHPLDGVAIQSVENSIGVDEQDLGVTNATTDWSKVSGYIQKANEPVDDFAQRFTETFLRHSGVGGLTENNISKSNHGALKANFLQNLSSELRQAIKLTSPTWEDVTYTFDMLIGAAKRVENSMEHRIRYVTDHYMFNNEYMVRGQDVGVNNNRVKHRGSRWKGNRHRSNDVCRKCGKRGHWAKECWTGSQGRNGTHPDSGSDSEYERFKKLSDC